MPCQGKEKADSLRAGLLVFLQWDGLFARDDSVVGTNLGARATFDAGIGIDVVDIAFRDCVNGANGLAGATSHARVSDYVSHD